MKRLAGSISILLCAVAFPAAGYAASRRLGCGR